MKEPCSLKEMVGRIYSARAFLSGRAFLLNEGLLLVPALRIRLLPWT